jgi:hypothetical protein
MRNDVFESVAKQATDETRQNKKSYSEGNQKGI